MLASGPLGPLSSTVLSLSSRLERSPARSMASALASAETRSFLAPREISWAEALSAMPDSDITHRRERTRLPVLIGFIVLYTLSLVESQISECEKRTHQKTRPLLKARAYSSQHTYSGAHCDCSWLR